MSGIMMPKMCPILVVTQLNLKNVYKCNLSFCIPKYARAGYHEKMIGRTYFGGDQATQLNLVLYNIIKWPYQPKHSPSPNRLSATPLIVQCQCLIHVSMLFVLWSQAM